jgi:4-oxalocrotonate tautomerase
MFGGRCQGIRPMCETPGQPHNVVRHLTATDERARVPLIQVKVLAGVFTTSQKQDIIERLTDALVEVQGENLRQHTWCVIEEVASGGWGVGGQAQTSDDLKALASD